MKGLDADMARLLSVGGDANRVVIEAGDAYVIVRARPGSDAATVEVSAGRQRPNERRLPAEVQQALHTRGYRRRTAADNFRRPQVPTGEVPAEVTAVLALLAPGSDATRALHLGETDPTENPELLGAMTRLSRARDMRARQEVYMALLRARLFVALAAPRPTGATELALRRVGTLAGGLVAAVFSDWKSLERYEPRGLPHSVVDGMELFPILAAQKVASVLINPHGHVGGELYRNEILTISDGAARLSGIH